MRPSPTSAALLVLTMGCVAVPSAAQAWAHTRLESGEALRLQADNPWVDAPYLPLAGSTANRAGIHPEELRDAVVEALLRWQSAAGGAFDFDYWQGSDPEVYVPRQERDGLSSLFFSSADPEGSPLDGRTPAWTRVWFDPDSHAIIEADIVLNDLNFAFTTDPAEVTYTDEGLLGQVLLLQDVVTHEIGHALGLDHSGVGSATMFTWSWFGQSVPGCDDVAAIRDLYGLHDEEHGSIAGQVLGAGDRPILGAQVTLVSTRRGTVVQSVLTDRDGTWRVDGLDDDEVVVLVEPFVAGPQNLSAYWSELDHAICLLGAFPRTFIASDDPSEPDLFPVRRGVDLWLPTLRIDCDGSGELPAADDPDAPHLLIDGPGASFARVVLAPAGPEDRWFLLRDVHKDFTLDVLGWTLNSPVRARPTLFDMHGVPVWTSEVTEPAWQDPISGYVAWDSRIDVDLPASGDYVLRLESDGLPETLYPGGERYRDDRPFVLLLGRSGRPDESVSAAERLDCASDLELPGYLGADGPVRRREVVGCSVAAPGPRPLTLLLVVLIVLASGRARGCARARVSAAEAQEQTRRAGQADAAGSGARCAGGRLG